MGWVITPKAASNPPAIISLLCHNVLYDACALMNTSRLDPVIVGRGKKKKVTFNDTQNINECINVSVPIRSAAPVRPKARVTVLAGGILKVSLGISDMAWRVSASRSDGSQSGPSDLHMAPYTQFSLWN